MRLRIGLALIALVLVGTAGATTLARSPEPRTLVLRSTVRELTADRTRAAVLLGRRETCAALIWTPGTGQRAPLSGRCSGSGRDSSYGIALTGSRAAWIQTSGGNVLEMNLMTSTGSDRRTRIVLVVYSGPGDGGDSIGEVRGDGGAHFFTVVRRCEAPEPDSQPGPFACPQGRSSGDVIGTDVWAYDQARAGARCPGETLSERCRLVTSAPERLTLLGADRGRLAIRLQGGPVEIRSVAGARLATISLPREHSQTALFGDRFLVRRKESVEVYRAATAALTGTFRPPEGARLVDAEGGLAVLVAGRTIHVVRITDRRTVRIRVPGSGVPHAQLEPAGLFYSYAVTRGRDRGRVAFLPLRALLRRFARAPTA